MRLLINNLANASNTTVNTPDADFPVANQYNNLLVEYTSISDHQDIDLTATPPSINTIGIVFSGQSSIQVYGSNTLGGTDFSQVITASVTFLSSAQTYRYWRFEVIGGGTNINHLYIGSYLQLGGVLADNPITPEFTDTDVSVTSQMGQKYSTAGIIIKNYSTVNVVDTDGTQYESFMDWWVTTDRLKHFLFVPFEDSLTQYPFKPFYCRLTNPTSPRRIIPFHHQWTFTITEVK